MLPSFIFTGSASQPDVWAEKTHLVINNNNNNNVAKDGSYSGARGLMVKQGSAPGGN